MCCGFWGIWSLSVTEGLGDLIALARNRVSGRWQVAGCCWAGRNLEQVGRSYIAYFSGLISMGILKLVQKRHQRTFTQGFLVWEMFLLFHT